MPLVTGQDNRPHFLRPTDWWYRFCLLDNASMVHSPLSDVLKLLLMRLCMQKPFMPLGTLRQQLLFPTGWRQQLTGATVHSAQHDILISQDQAHNKEQPGSCVITMDDRSSMDQRLQELLQSVKLDQLLHRFHGGLDAEVDWASVLSLGEQQRVALVRLLYHKPDLAFLDEGTAALDPQTEAIAYNMVAASCSSYVSIGHRQQLLDWHTHVLVSNEQGSWSMYTVSDYKQRLVTGMNR
eukprot:GHUV01024737.1.p1 GENE.GHUV01024737.1~~GHUV01024737.1.p1  ORF type:complete len:238 (+),score=45.82 GHUV01024737.1:561-1274(+)